VANDSWPTECARCGEDLRQSGHGMSFFNRDVCCRACLHDERTAPGFEAAHDAEVAAVSERKDYNFPGVGLSDADKSHLAALLAQRGKTPRFQ
jgi:hypothetical protein